MLQKTLLLSLTCRSCLFIILFFGIVSLANAGYREALDAYQEKNGQAMLKEVKQAVLQNDDEGLLLLLSMIKLDQQNSRKVDLYKFQGSKSHSLLKSILDAEELSEMHQLLMAAAKRNGMPAQFIMPHDAFTDEMQARRLHNQVAVELVARKYLPAMIARWHPLPISPKPTEFEVAKEQALMLQLAEAGDFYSQVYSGINFLDPPVTNFTHCAIIYKSVACLEGDQPQADYWIGRAIRTYEAGGRNDIGQLSSVMCQYLNDHANGDKTRIREAYRWCLYGLSSLSYPTGLKLRKLQESYGIPTYADAAGEVPNLVRMVRKEIQGKNLPIFSYYMNDYLEYQLNVYADGLVTIGISASLEYLPFPEINLVDDLQSPLMKSSPQHVQKFLEELRKTGFEDWPLNNSIVGMCDWPDPTQCLGKEYQFTLRQDVPRKVLIGGVLWYMLPDEGSQEEKPEMKRVAEVSVLVEQYFPTRHLRCYLNNSPQYQEACLARDERWRQAITKPH